MVKQYRNINEDIKRVLSLANDRIIEQYQNNIHTTRYPQSITDMYEKDIAVIERLKKSIRI